MRPLAYSSRSSGEPRAPRRDANHVERKLLRAVAQLALLLSAVLLVANLALLVLEVAGG